jgi:V8-like Glu-specific endopeptidase
MLPGPEQLKWRDALFNAFSEQEFIDLLWHRLGLRIGKFASVNKPWETVIGDVVDAFSRRNEEDLLIAKAVETRPRDPALVGLARGKRALAAPDDASVERLIQQSNSFLDLGKWLEAAGKLQVCVCRIEIAIEGGGRVFGTGFLIAPDLVMTNYHIVECIVTTEDHDATYSGPRATASGVICRFDYKVLSNGMTNQGLTASLAANWRVALSPNNPQETEPTASQLDCAVIRLSKPLGELAIGEKPELQGDRRGWIRLPQIGVRPELADHSSLFIIQHPEGHPIKLALSTDAIQCINGNRTRVRYSTNTEPGSSGSPCFDQNWNLVALHHAGDPNFAPSHAPEYNEGIPIDAVVNFLNEKGIVNLG